MHGVYVLQVELSSIDSIDILGKSTQGVVPGSENVHLRL